MAVNKARNEHILRTLVMKMTELGYYPIAVEDDEDLTRVETPTDVVNEVFAVETATVVFKSPANNHDQVAFLIVPFNDADEMIADYTNRDWVTDVVESLEAVA